MKKVIIIDDHAIMRKGLVTLVSEIEGFEVAAEGTTGKDLFPIISSISPDLIILDINMPEMNGIETLTELNKQGLQFNILMSSMLNEYIYIKQCLKLGARGFIFKDETNSEYIEAIKTVSQGEPYLTQRTLKMYDSLLKNDKS